MRTSLVLATLVSLSACRSDKDFFDDDEPEVEAVDEDGDGWSDEEDCDDQDAAVSPDATEICDEIDNNCDGQIDEEQTLTLYEDADGDGFGDAESSTEACELTDGWVTSDSDCDDTDVDSYPDADERCDDLDNDCDGEIDEDVLYVWYADADQDGFGDAGTAYEICDPPSGSVADDSDCNDTAPSAYPGAEEVCDEIDNNCDGLVDEDVTTTYYVDTDGDGFGTGEITTEACTTPSGYSENSSDCEDGNAMVSPLGTELCDEIDNDCDGDIDEADAADASTWYLDGDGDGYGDAWVSVDGCSQPTGYVSDATDCDDSSTASSPSQSEVCDGVDNDCDGSTDEDATDATIWYADDDGDGYGDATAMSQGCSAGSGEVSDATDCDDTSAEVHPDATEICDGVDNDCDGSTDEDDATGAATWYADSDGDGYGDGSASSEACTQPTGYVSNDSDCDDTEGTVSPVATELCDGVDNDCDGSADEDDAADASTWYADGDGDGYGDASSSAESCDAPTGYVSDATDCDDADASASPAQTESCNGVDNDCDGDIDEDDASDAATWYADDDGDGYGDSGSTTEACDAPSGSVSDDSDCDDSDSDSYPGATEVCDEVDNDCDGIADEGVESTWYLDYDGDGWGDDDTAIESCDAPTAYYIDVGDDCDDTDAAFAPDATPGCDGEDYDCDGLVDSDVDLDGYADADCGGDDCDDSDDTVLPEVGGGCALGTTCLDILDSGYSEGDGTYTIDPDGYGAGLDPFDVPCDMTTDGGGWTAIEYATDLNYQQHFSGGDAFTYLDDNFEFVLSDEEIEAVQGLSTEGTQTYEGLCEHVIHYYYNAGASYGYAFGFMFFDGTETPSGGATYTPYDISVVEDGCASNGGEGGAIEDATVFEITSVLLPVLNVQCRDCGDANEEFGSILTDWPAWLR